MLKSTTYTQAVQQFAGRPIVTIATGATCAYLGDERNLREFLIADETARHLCAAGHVVFSLLIDDSLDPLTFRQLRVAVDKDPELVRQYEPWCGRPIGLLPDPWGCHDSYAGHFEAKLLDRLHGLDCHPTLISTAALYRNGAYAPYVRDILERYDEVLGFLQGRFPHYTPDKLFWALCPDCGFIDDTRVESVGPTSLGFYCGRCQRSRTIGFDDVRGKFNWKLDCALRWALFGVDAEPFNKAYLEPQAGSFVVAQALSQEFFGGRSVLPLHYGTVKMDKRLGNKLLQSLPGAVLRGLLVDKPSSDLALSDELIMTSASRQQVLPGLSYLDFIRQQMPVWLLAPEALTPSQRELLTHGIAFSHHFLGTECGVHLPTRVDIGDERPEVLRALLELLNQVINVRPTGGALSGPRPASPSDEELQQIIRQRLAGLGEHKKAVLHRLRLLTGQEHGLPATRLLSCLPPNYLQMLTLLIEMRLGAETATRTSLRLAA